MFEILTSTYAPYIAIIAFGALTIRGALQLRRSLTQIRLEDAKARLDLAKLREAESDAIGGKPTDGGHAPDLDFNALWLWNQRRLDNYHTIATGQSKTSFISTQVVTGAGFLLILIVGIVATRAETVAGAISAGSVGLIGTGLSAYISATFMKAQASANAQLQQFFLQPVEFARTLAAERLLEHLPQDQRGESVKYMIRSAMLTSRGADDQKATKPVDPKASQKVTDSADPQ